MEEEAGEIDQKGSVKIENGSDFVKLIDSIYRCDKETMKKVDTLVPPSETQRILLKDNSFFLAAAEELSFHSIAFVINLGVSMIFQDDFTL